MRLVRSSFRAVIPWVRLAAFLTAVSALILVVGLRRVRADILEAGLVFGDALDGLGDVLPKPYIVRFNGQQAFVAAVTLDEAPGVALDRMEGLCRAHDGGLLDAIAVAASKAGFVPPTMAVAAPVPGLLRKETARGGFVGCLGQDHHLGFAEVSERLGRVANDGNLAHLGHLRFASVRRTASGRTHLVVVWTSGSLIPREAFPANADAPGTDVAGVGKPDGSRRVLAASIDGAPYGVRVYAAHELNPDACFAQFEAKLVSGGFVRDALENTTGARSYRRGAEELVVHAEASRDGSAILSVVSMGQGSGHAP